MIEGSLREEFRRDINKALQKGKVNELDPSDCIHKKSVVDAIKDRCSLGIEEVWRVILDKYDYRRRD